MLGFVLSSVGLTLAGPPENAPNAPILTDVYQSALYSDCLMATDANALKAVKKLNAFTDAKTLSSDMAKAGPSLPALQALTPGPDRVCHLSDVARLRQAIVADGKDQFIAGIDQLSQSRIVRMSDYYVGIYAVECSEDCGDLQFDSLTSIRCREAQTN